MHRLTKLIHAADLFHPIPICQKHLQISCQAGWLAGDIHQFIHSILDDLWQGLGVYSVSWRIQDDEIRFLLHLIQDLQHISSNKPAVCDPVKGGVFFGSFYCFLHDLHANDFFCHFCQDLGDGAGSAVQIKDGHIPGVSDIFSCCIVKDLSGKRIGLEE